MKKLFAIVAMVATLTSCITCSKYNSLKAKYDVYYRYYNHTEAFLDTLNNAYDWVDAYDNEGYYQSVSEIDSLKKGLK